MAAYRTLDDLAVAGRRVLVRVDLNVPVENGAVADPTRIERVQPTLAELTDKGARMVVLSHLGRPNGKVVRMLSLKPLVDPLSKSLGGRAVAFAADCVGAEAEAAVGALVDGGLALLENLRFHAGEEANAPDFADALARLGEFYVNDAFSVSHRAHASTVGLPRRLPAAAGRLMQTELEALDQALEHPVRPMGAVVGGAKVSTKLRILRNLVKKIDLLVLGGGMANTFLHARGVEVGKSLCERNLADEARTILKWAEESGCEVLLPEDAVTATAFEAGARRAVTPVARVAPDAMILDVGPATVEAAAERLKRLKTLVWNGPLGAFELAGFDEGTNRLAWVAADLTGAGRLVTVAGGGDTVAALARAGVAEAFTYLSTAGGAFLQWLEGKELPGVAALRA